MDRKRRKGGKKVVERGKIKKRNICGKEKCTWVKAWQEITMEGRMEDREENKTLGMERSVSNCKELKGGTREKKVAEEKVKKREREN